VRIRAALALVIAIVLQALAVDADPPGPPGVPSPVPIVTPAPVSTSAPTTTEWTVNRTAIGLVIDQLTDKMFGVFLRFADKSVHLAQTLFMSLAGIELGWTSIRWFASQVPLEEYVANSMFKIVQLSLLFMVISNSYSSPFGPGWFMMVVNGIVGMAQDTAGFDVIGLSPTGQFAPTITPGTILDIGLRLFTLIMTAASTGSNAWNLIGGMTNGATMIYFARWCFCLLSACCVVALMAWIAYRWLWVTMVALWQGSMVFLTGFTGSRVTASIGYGPFNAAFNVGVEMAAHVVIIGIFYPIITVYVNSIGFGNALQSLPVNVGPTPIGGAPSAALVVQIGAILLLDLGIALWAYAIKHAPDLGAGVISGAIRLNEKDALEGAKSESTTLQGGALLARVGAGGVAGFAGGSSGDDSRQPSIQDRLKGAFSGAVRGGLMAGPEGAIGGAAMGAATAKPASASRQTEGRVHGGGAGSADAAAAGRTGSFTGGFVQPGRTPSGTTSSAHATGSRPQPTPGAPDLPVDANAAAAQAGAPGEQAGAGEVGGGASMGGRVTESSFGNAPGDRAAEASRSGSGANGRASSANAMPGSQTAGAAQAGGAGGDPRQPRASQSRPAGGAGGAGASPDGGSAHDGPLTAEAVVEALTRALRENTEALHGRGEAGAGARAGGGASNGAGSGALAGVLGGGAAASPVNMMLYRQLLSAGRRQKPDVHNERPAVSLGVGHIE
jgi:hypothetical protein